MTAGWPVSDLLELTISSRTPLVVVRLRLGAGHMFRPLRQLVQSDIITEEER